jgi:hypothetical protein
VVVDTGSQAPVDTPTKTKSKHTKSHLIADALKKGWEHIKRAALAIHEQHCLFRQYLLDLEAGEYDNQCEEEKRSNNIYRESFQ